MTENSNVHIVRYIYMQCELADQSLSKSKMNIFQTKISAIFGHYVKVAT